MKNKSEALDAFTIASPAAGLNPAARQGLLRMQIAFKETVLEIFDLVPENAYRTVALHKLLEAKMACVQSLTHGMGASESELYVEEPKQEKAKRGKSKKD